MFRPSSQHSDQDSHAERCSCIPLRRIPAFCSFSRMVSRVSRKPGFSSACEVMSASSLAQSTQDTTYGLQLDLCLPAVVGIGCKRGFNATPQAGSVHGDASGSVAVRRPAMGWKNRMAGSRGLRVRGCCELCDRYTIEQAGRWAVSRHKVGCTRRKFFGRSKGSAAGCQAQRAASRALLDGILLRKLGRV
jgi:hypothetical protein